jgi:tetratricopeptide (TPR) repeat protein
VSDRGLQGNRGAGPIARLRRCIELHARLSAGDRRGAHQANVGAQSWLAHSLARRGEFTEAIAVATAARSVADAGDSVFSRTVAHSQLAWIHLMRRELEVAIPLFERGLELARAAEVRVSLPSLAVGLGHARLLAGRRDDGIALLEEVASELDSEPQQFAFALRTACLGEGYLLADQAERARERAARALEIARQHKERGIEAQALWLLGETFARREPPDVEQAERCYREALALADELGTRLPVAHGHLSLGELCRRTSKRQEAREHLSTATSIYREMGMTYWLEKAEEERST